MRNKKIIGLDVAGHWAPGYKPLLNSDGDWMAALMNGTKKSWSVPDIIERHPRTDELFVLTKGRAVMITAGSHKKPGTLRLMPMRHNVLYNVKRGTWHITPMTKDATLVIIERKGTNINGSVLVDLTAEQKQSIKL